MNVNRSCVLVEVAVASGRLHQPSLRRKANAASDSSRRAGAQIRRSLTLESLNTEAAQKLGNSPGNVHQHAGNLPG